MCCSCCITEEITFTDEDKMKFLSSVLFLIVSLAGKSIYFTPSEPVFIVVILVELLLLRIFSVAISVSPHVCFILDLILISMFLR